jgi:hypothetical protein
MRHGGTITFLGKAVEIKIHLSLGAFDGYSDAGTRCRYQNGAARTRRLRQLGKSSQPIETKWADLAPVGKIAM